MNAVERKFDISLIKSIKEQLSLRDCVKIMSLTGSMANLPLEIEKIKMRRPFPGLSRIRCYNETNLPRKSRKSTIKYSRKFFNSSDFEDIALGHEYNRNEDVKSQLGVAEAKPVPKTHSLTKKRKIEVHETDKNKDKLIKRKAINMQTEAENNPLTVNEPCLSAMDDHPDHHDISRDNIKKINSTHTTTSTVDFSSVLNQISIPEFSSDPDSEYDLSFQILERPLNETRNALLNANRKDSNGCLNSMIDEITNFVDDDVYGAGVSQEPDETS